MLSERVNLHKAHRTRPGTFETQINVRPRDLHSPVHRMSTSISSRSPKPRGGGRGGVVPAPSSWAFVGNTQQECQVDGLCRHRLWKRLGQTGALRASQERGVASGVREGITQEAAWEVGLRKRKG